MLIDDATPNDVLFPAGFATGLVPRDYGAQMLQPVNTVEMPTIPRSEWSARIKEMERTGSRLSDVRRTAVGGRPMPSLDQNPWGYCWGHSATHAVMLLRARDNQPYVPLSAFAVCATIKKGADRGGWGADALQFASDRGIPSQALWPQKDADYRRHDTPEVWADAAKHKVSEGWVDVSAPVWGRKMSFDQVMTCLLCRVPVVMDLNWWGHSVCGMDPVEVEPGSFGVRILNSWSDAWGDLGESVLRGERAVPDNATAPRTVTAAA